MAGAGRVPKKGGLCTIRGVRPAIAAWLVNQNSITPHVWISRVPNLYQPDICVFDPTLGDQPELFVPQPDCANC
jgi:DNA primase